MSIPLGDEVCRNVLAVITEACLGGEDDSVGELHLSDLDRFEEGRNG